MKNQTLGTQQVPAIVAIGEGIATVKDQLKEQVNECAIVQEYKKACKDETGEVATAEAGRWYNRAVAAIGFGIVCPPLFIAAAYFVYRAHEAQKGGEL